MLLAGSALWTSQTRMENGPGKGGQVENPYPHPILTGRQSRPCSAVTRVHTAAAGRCLPLRVASAWDLPRPQRAPQTWRGGSHTPKLRMSTETSPKAKWKWLLDYTPFGWIICTIASVHYWGEPGGSGLSLEFQDDLVESWLQSVCGKRRCLTVISSLSLVQRSLIFGLWLDPILKSLSLLVIFLGRPQFRPKQAFPLAKLCRIRICLWDFQAPRVVRGGPLLHSTPPRPQPTHMPPGCTPLPPSHKKNRCQHSCMGSHVWTRKRMRGRIQGQGLGESWRSHLWELGYLLGGLFWLARRASASATASFTSQSPDTMERPPEPQNGSLALVLPISDFLGPLLLLPSPPLSSHGPRDKIHALWGTSNIESKELTFIST